MYTKNQNRDLVRLIARAALQTQFAMNRVLRYTAQVAERAPELSSIRKKFFGAICAHRQHPPANIERHSDFHPSQQLGEILRTNGLDGKDGPRAPFRSEAAALLVCQARPLLAFGYITADGLHNVDRGVNAQVGELVE